MALKDMFGGATGQNINRPAGWGSFLGQLLGGIGGDISRKAEKEAKGIADLRPRMELAEIAGQKYTDEATFLKDWATKKEKNIIDKLAKKIDSDETSAKADYIAEKDNPEKIKEWALLTGYNWTKDYNKQLNKELPTFEREMQIIPFLLQKQKIGIAEQQQKVRLAQFRQQYATKNEKDGKAMLDRLEFIQDFRNKWHADPDGLEAQAIKEKLAELFPKKWGDIFKKLETKASDDPLGLLE